MKKILILITILFSLNIFAQDDLDSLINSLLQEDNNIAVETVKNEPVLNKFDVMSKEELDLYVKIYMNEKDENEIYDIAKAYATKNYLSNAQKVASLGKDTKNIYLVATTSRYLGDYKKAIEKYRQVLSVKPNHLNSILGIGLSYIRVGDKSTAITYLQNYYDQTSNTEVKILINELMY